MFLNKTETIARPGGRLGNLVVLTSFIIVFAGLPAFAQSVGSIDGLVSDNTGGSLPGTTVVVTNEETGATRTVVTDHEGRYRALDLALGLYRVEASLTGFRTVVRQGIVLTIGREAVVNLELPIGELTEELIVTGDAPLVQTRSGEAGALVSREQMANLPLNARDFTQLISLQAGATQIRGVEGNNISGYGNRISVGGARPSANVFTLDGSDIQTPTGQLPAGVTGAALGLEAVQEFKILTSSYSAQYGRASGATVVAATRAGTNRLQGSGYWYYRNDMFDARNFFDAEKPPFSRHQYGASLGGPIIRNQTFFFANWEQLAERLPQRSRLVVPTVAARQGILPTRTVTVADLVKPYVALYPLPNGQDFGDGTAEYFREWNRPTDQDYASGRVDHQFNANTSIFVRYTRETSKRTVEQDLRWLDAIFKTRNQYVTIEQRRLFSSRFMNQVRLSYSRTLAAEDSIELDPPDPALSFYAGRPFGTLNVTPLSQMQGAGRDRSQDVINMGQLHDDARFEFGQHTLHFGGVVSLMQYNKLGISRAGGEWDFGSLVDFLLNNPPTRMRIMGFDADPYRTFEQRTIAAYVQDDFRIRSNVTLNLGVRVENTTSPTERYGRLANVRSLTDSQPTVGEPYFQNPGVFASPRLGLAWDPTGKGTMSVRSGFGVFHEPLLMRYYVNAMDRQPPFWSDVDPVPGELPGLFPNLNPHLERLSKGPQAVHVFEFSPSHPYSMQWHLTFQRLLAGSVAVETGYTGSRGLHLPARRGLAVPVPSTVDGVTFYPPSAEFLNPSFSRLEYYDTSATSTYHSLRLSATKRQAAGLHLQGGYTWSKAMDTQSAILAGELAGTTMMDPFNPRRDWAPADYHVNHMFTGNVGYEIPWGANLDGWRGGLVRGWQVAGILSLYTGRPFSVSSNGTITHRFNRGGSRPDLVPGGNNNPVLGGPQLYFDPTQFKPQAAGFYGTTGRNTLIGPGLVSLDASVIKRQPLGGARSLEFRLEVFNILNRTNFGLPVSALFNARGALSGTAGRITNTVTTGRQMQLALRVTF